MKTYIGYEETGPGLMVENPVWLDSGLHTLLVGKSRTGKSTAALRSIVSDIDAGKGVFVLDPHGPLIDAVLHHINEDRLKDIVLIDPTADRVPGIGYFDSGDTELCLQHFEAQMEARAGRNGGPRTSEIFRAFGRAAVGHFDKPTIAHVYRLLNRDAFATSVLSKCADPLVRDFHEFWYGKDVKAKDRHDAFGAPRNKIDELMQPGIREIVAQPTMLDWARMMDDRKIILVNVRKGKIGSNKAKAIGNLALMNLILASFSRKNPERKVTAYVDEAHNFLDGVDVETAMAESAKNGMAYFWIVQTLAQLRDEDRRIYNDEIILGNCGNIMACRVSGADADQLFRDFADEKMKKALVELPNYRLFGWLLYDNAPVLKGPVHIYPNAKDYGPGESAMPFSKVMDWVRSNAPGRDRVTVDAEILSQLAE